MGKKVLLVLLIFLVSFSQNPLVANESFEDNQNSSNYEMSDEEAAYTNNPERLKKIEEKFTYANLISMRKPRSGYYRVNYVVPRKQEKSFYCGPAVAQMIIHYWTGRYFTQGELANDSNLRTDSYGQTEVWLLSQVLQRHANSNYEHTDIRNRIFTNLVYATISNGSILAANPKTKNLVGYNGLDYKHYVVINGVNYGWSGTHNYEDLHYIDPYDNYQGTFGAHWYNVVDMKNAILNNSGCVVW